MLPLCHILNMAVYDLPKRPSASLYHRTHSHIPELRYPHLILPVLIIKYIFMSLFCLLNTHKCILFNIDSHTQPYNKNFLFYKFRLDVIHHQAFILKKPFSRNLKLQMPIFIFKCNNFRRFFVLTPLVVCTVMI